MSLSRYILLCPVLLTYGCSSGNQLDVAEQERLVQQDEGAPLPAAGSAAFAVEPFREDVSVALAPVPKARDKVSDAKLALAESTKLSEAVELGSLAGDPAVATLDPETEAQLVTDADLEEFVHTPRMCTELEPQGTVPPREAAPGQATLDEHGHVTRSQPQHLVAPNGYLWTPGQTLRVRLIGGSDFVRSKVREYASVWTQHANLRFDFVDEGPAEMVTTFEPGGSYSHVGRREPSTAPSMNFGWLDDFTSELEFARVILHEFGHALGFIHEHSSPTAVIAWDRERLYRYYTDLGYSRAFVDSQILERYAATQTNYSAYDPMSIMHYAIDPSLTYNGVGVPWNTQLSELDMSYARLWYPASEVVSSTRSVLETGDDCDQVQTDVEYDVVAHDRIQFRLRPLSGSPFADWWKGIGVPTLGGVTWLEMQDLSQDDRTFIRSEIDETRPIQFAKAKFLGAHTVLDYTWNPWQALPGGSRITLTWVRSRCP